MRDFVRALTRDAFTHAPAEIDQIAGAMEIDRRYDPLRLGLVDSCGSALAERLGPCRIATRDVRHFTAIRFADESAFELVVNPTDPDGLVARTVYRFRPALPRRFSSAPASLH